MEIYDQIKQDIGVILEKSYQQKRVEIIEARAYSYADKYPAQMQCITMGYLNGKGSLMIFD